MSATSDRGGSPARTGLRAYPDPFAALHGLLSRPLASYYLLLSSAGLLLVIGLVMVFSATSVDAYQTSGNAFADATEQAMWALIGIVAFWIAQRLPVGAYRLLGYPLMLVSVLVAGMLALFPNIDTGTVRTDDNWVVVSGLQFQPSEIAKLALALWGADVLVRKGAEAAEWKTLAMPLFPITGLLFLLVGYRDLGTMICLLLVFLGLLWVTGVRFRVFGSLFGIALAGVVLLISAEPYRLQRILAFGDPQQVSDSTGWQAIQGYYALADGGWFGVGLGEGRQKWDWLPNAHNDFIFAIIGEELGVIGSLVVLGLFAVLTYAGLRIARRVADPFRRTVATGCTIWIAGQSVVNIGAVVGLLPITGVPLPFISAGGTALVVTLIAIGMLASFARAEPDAARALRARAPGRLARLLWAPLPPAVDAGAVRRDRAPAGAGAPAARAGSTGSRTARSQTGRSTRSRTPKGDRR